uniref:Uncharacterized protein n=1 Tax=Sinocyclocheilus anshuiensis TaxID=1608454 RepID=A0A671QMN6_9TELE
MQEELTRLVYECNKKDDENGTLNSKLKHLEEERTRLQRTTNLFLKCEGLQQQVELESMKRTHKQAASTQTQTEHVFVHVTFLFCLCTLPKDSTSQEQQKFETLQAENRKLERQKAELILHSEAAKLLSFTEEEFMKALDWGKDGVSLIGFCFVFCK